MVRLLGTGNAQTQGLPQHIAWGCPPTVPCGKCPGKTVELIWFCLLVQITDSIDVTVLAEASVPLLGGPAPTVEIAVAHWHDPALTLEVHLSKEAVLGIGPAL